MSFIKCLSEKLEKNLITEEKAEQLQEKFNALEARFKKTMPDHLAAAKAASDIVNAEANLIIQKKRNDINHAIKLKNLNKELDLKINSIETGVGLFKKNLGDKTTAVISDLYEKAFQRGLTLRKELLSGLSDFIDKFDSKFAGLSDFMRDVDAEKKIIKEVLGESSGSAEAHAFGQAIRNMFDLAHGKYKASGGIIGKIENYFPQIHSTNILKKTTFDDWFNFLEPRLDRNRMIDQDTALPMDDIKFRSVVKDIYDDIVTDGASSINKRINKGNLNTPRGRGSEVSLQRQDARFFHFKNADSFLEYNAKFGSGDRGLIGSIFTHAENISRETGMLEILGPKPNAVNRFLDLKANAARTSDVKKVWLNAQFDVLSGRTGSSNSWWFQLLGSTQNLLRSALLGSAPVSAISDSTFIVATARINGFSGTKVLKQYFSQLNPLDSTAKQIARRSEYISESITAGAADGARFAGEGITGSRATAWLSSFTNRASGLETMTVAAKNAISLEFEATMAELVGQKISFEGLDFKFRSLLEKHNIFKDDWDIIQKTSILQHPENGSKFLRAKDVSLIEPEDGIDPVEFRKKTANITRNLSDAIGELRSLAANEPSLRTRSITSGAIAGINPVAKAIFSTGFLFKSFPLTVMFNHVLPALRQASVGLTTGKIDKLEYFATVFAGTTILGAAAMQSREFIKGKTPRNMEDPKFWTAAMLQGGGLGLFGDFLFSDFSRFGRDPVVEFFTGPIGGLSSDVLRTFKGNLDRTLINGSESNFTKDLFNLAKRNTPAVSLWYSRLIVERLILDKIERMTDPSFDKRIRKLEKKLKKEGDQAFWWKRGKSLPGT